MLSKHISYRKLCLRSDGIKCAEVVHVRMMSSAYERVCCYNLTVWKIWSFAVHTDNAAFLSSYRSSGEALGPAL